MAAVAQVVLNRRADPRWPGTVCGVVRQGGERPIGRCQFSWWCDGRSDTPREREAWARAQEVAEAALSPRWAPLEHLELAQCYYAPGLRRRPEWADEAAVVSEVGAHRFYQC